MQLLLEWMTERHSNISTASNLLSLTHPATGKVIASEEKSL